MGLPPFDTLPHELTWLTDPGGQVRAAEASAGPWLGEGVAALLGPALCAEALAAGEGRWSLELGEAPRLLLTLELRRLDAPDGALLHWTLRRAHSGLERLVQSRPQLLAQILESVRDGVVVVDGEGRIQVHNKRMSRDWSVGAPTYWKDMHAQYEVLTAPGGRRVGDHETPVARALRGESVRDEPLWVRGPGAPEGVSIRVSARPVLDAAGQVAGVVETIADMGEEERLAFALRESEARYRELTELVADFAYELRLDPSGLIHVPGGPTLKVSWLAGRFTGLTGWTLEELQEQGGMQRLIHPGDQDVLSGHLRAVLAEGAHEVEMRLTTREGESRWVRDRARAEHDPETGALVRILGAARDVTDHKLNDRLTGLPNLRAYRDRLAVALGQIRRWPDESVAVLYVDLDRFQTYNQSLGYSAGDEILRVCARRLQALVKPGDTVAHLRSDEFGVLLTGRRGHAEVLRAAQHFVDALAEPVRLQGATVSPGASVGITFASGPADAPAELLRAAQTAAMRAWHLGGGRFEVYDPQMQQLAISRLRRETALRDALRNDRLQVHYQPIVNMHTEAVVGFEALVRLDDPELGLLGPDTFIPLAEETGLIVDVGEHVLRRACRQVQLWRQRLPGRASLSISVNLSPRQLIEDDLLPRLERALLDSGLPGGNLQLEITETALVSPHPGTDAMLREMRRRGVRLCLDDFGTGHSSLAYLQRFPVTSLKVDRAFVRVLGRDPAQERIAGTIVALAEHLGLEVVAEGVETREQLAILRRMGCNYAQGYLFGPALPPEEARLLLERG